MARTWRDSAGPIIAKVIAEHGTDDMKALRKALREAYPFWERKYWPYKVWCDEIHRQLHRKMNAPLPPPSSPPGPLEVLMQETP